MHECPCKALRVADAFISGAGLRWGSQQIFAGVLGTRRANGVGISTGPGARYCSTGDSRDTRAGGAWPLYAALRAVQYTSRTSRKALGKWVVSVEPVAGWGSSRPGCAPQGMRERGAFLARRPFPFNK